MFTVCCLCMGSDLTLAAVINGKIIDDAGKPVSLASVILLRAADSSLVKSELTNDQGAYEFVSVADGTYLLKVTLIGYQAYTSDKFTLSCNIAQPDITLHSTSKELKEIAVRAQKQFIEVYADKLVVNVENTIVNAGGSVMDVLSRSPGVNVDQNDNITLKGKPCVNIMINGKIQPLGGTDLANMLKSMPSNSVETIELIANPSAKYDVAGTGGIINIKMKKDNKTGLNGTDIFWHGYPSATSDYSNYNEFFVAQRDTRQVSISFTYRFGKRTVPPSRRHSGGAEDEKSRAGQGG